MGISGGMRGEPVKLAPCKTVDVPYIADAEIVLEAEILPTGWTYPEGRFGEVHLADGRIALEPAGSRESRHHAQGCCVLRAPHAMGEYMDDGSDALRRRSGRRFIQLGSASRDINVTMGGVTFWHAVISIRKQAGEGKNALLRRFRSWISSISLSSTTTSISSIPVEVEWAIATRVQGDRDIMIVNNARAKPLDPSLPPTPPGVVPTTAKVGIDATISEGIPKERFERITYAYAETAKIADYIGRQGGCDRRSRVEKNSSGTSRKNCSCACRNTSLFHGRCGAFFRIRVQRGGEGDRTSCMSNRNFGRIRAASFA